jgi:hypothetical protein
MIEKLENDKKTYVQNKNFKDAKKTKDFISMKQEKKEKVIKENEEFKEAIAIAEENVEKTKRVQAAISKKLVSLS